MYEKLDENPLHTPSVVGPNSVPTGSRFETSTENYAAGSANIEVPAWLRAEAERFAKERAERLEHPIDTVVKIDLI